MSESMPCTKHRDTIEEIFKENIYRLFRQYCNVNGIKYMDELNNFDFDKLYSVPGLGNVKIDRIKERWNAYINQQNTVQKKNEEPNIERVTIKEVFQENLFRLFREYCDLNGIRYMDELNNFDFDELYSVPGLGKAKINKIKKRWENYVSKQKQTTVIMKVEQEKKLRIINIHNSNKDLGIDYLNAIGVSKKVTKWLKSNGFHRLGDLERLDWDELLEASSLSHYNIGVFKERIKLLNEPIDIENLFWKMLNELKQKKCMIVLLERACGLTLKEIRNKRCLSRQRISQIESSAIELFKSFTNIFEDFIVSKLGGKEKAVVTLDEFLTFIGNQNDLLLFKYVLSKDILKHLTYLEELEIFLIYKNVEKIRDSLRNIVENYLPDIFDFEERIPTIEELLERFDLSFIDIKLFQRYLFSLGYKQYNKYLCKNNVTLSKILNFIVKIYFPNGIAVYDSMEIERVKHILAQDFGFSEFPSDRTLSARIAASTVLCDKGKYISPEFIEISPILLKEIKEYIENNSSETLLFADIFKIFEEKLKKFSNVNNPYFLHGVLRYYFENEFNFSRVTVSKGHKKALSPHVLLEKYLKECGRPVSKKEIKLRYPSVNDAMLNNATSINPNIINWDTGYYAHSSILKISENDIDFLKEQLIESFKNFNGYTNSYIMYRQLRSKMREFLLENQIRNPLTLFNVLEYIFGKEFYFSKPHILLNAPTKRFTTKDLIYNYFQENIIVSLRDLTSYLSKLYINMSTVYVFLAELQSELIQLSEDEYILKKFFNLSENAIKLISVELNKHFRDKEYLMLSSIKEFYSFPLLEYKWTHHLFKSIINHYLKDFKVIDREFALKRDVTSVIVKKDSNINSYTDLILFILRDECSHKTFSSLKELENWLRQRELISKTVPKELISSEAISIGEDGRVYVN